MRRSIVSAVLALLLCVNLTAANWVKVIARADQSLSRISTPFIDENGDEASYICTGFSINEKKGYVLTAAHCYHGESMFVDEMPAIVTFVDQRYDLLVLTVLGEAYPALKPRHRIAAKGLPVVAVGYGYGKMASIAKVAHIGNPWFQIGPEPWFVVDTGYVGGMSGGPVLDGDGLVVGTIQRTDDVTGAGRPLAVVLELTGKFWQYR